ncbi:hypothetical protein JTB14_012512 [Gonioctena quinquepunctata]|nr:hypothetical protein JTB14_012512 [Gonioctena quinquepunctata]
MIQTQVRSLESHECRIRKTGYLGSEKEVRLGLNSKLFFKYGACGFIKFITTNPTDETQSNVNNLASCGATADGKEYFFMEENFAEYTTNE